MKAFFITTTTNETCKHYESFLSLPGNEVKLYIYVNGSKIKNYATGDVLDEQVYSAAKEYAPDLIIYIGACGGNTPSIPLFRRLNTDIAPVVHFCSDASDDPWWPHLIRYDQEKCFGLQVALDGSHNWPLNGNQLSALTVVDPRFFTNAFTAHANRPIPFGFAGNVTGGRAPMLQQLQKLGLNVRIREGGVDTYGAFANYLCQCRMTVNFAGTGSGRHMHVKGRVLESAFARILLLEPRGSPTAQWFTPGADYLEYDDAAHCKSLVDHYATRPEESEAIADSLSQRARNEHGPAQFWGRVFERLQLKVPV